MREEKECRGVLKSLKLISSARNEILRELDPNFAPQEESWRSRETGGKGFKTPALRAPGRDLTELARKNELDP